MRMWAARARKSVRPETGLGCRIALSVVSSRTLVKSAMSVIVSMNRMVVCTMVSPTSGEPTRQRMAPTKMPMMA